MEDIRLSSSSTKSKPTTQPPCRKWAKENDHERNLRVIEGTFNPVAYKAWRDDRSTERKRKHDEARKQAVARRHHNRHLRSKGGGSKKRGVKG